MRPAKEVAERKKLGPPNQELSYPTPSPHETFLVLYAKVFVDNLVMKVQRRLVTGDELSSLQGNSQVRPSNFRSNPDSIA